MSPFFKVGLLGKLALMLLLIVMAAVALLSVFVLQLERFRVESEMRGRAEIMARNLSYNSEYGILTDNHEYLDRLISNLMAEKLVVFAQIIDREGRVLAAGNRPVPGDVYTRELPVSTIVTERAVEEIGLAPLAPATGARTEQLIGSVKLGLSLAAAARSTRQLILMVLGGSLVILLAAFLGVYLAYKYLLVVPIRQLLAVTLRVAGGEFDRRVELESADELGELAENFNRMTDRLKRSRDDLEEKVRERTAELEKVKMGLEEEVALRTQELRDEKEHLENKVAERTAELEKSRRAMLHMMKDLKEDVDKLKVVDQMKTEFISVISHELRTPITPIKGYASMLLSGTLGPLTPDQQRAIGVVKKESDHLLLLMDSILDVSRMARGRTLELAREPLLVRGLIEEVVEAMQPQAEAREITVSAELPADLPTILGDRTKLIRVLSNLIGNSLKFTPQGGKIMASAAAREGAVEISVKDDGVGIAPENQVKVFDKFYQVDSSYTRAAGGVGLGLAIAKEIVEAHGGRIRLESAGVGRGTTFIVTLPIGG